LSDGGFGGGFGGCGAGGDLRGNGVGGGAGVTTETIDLGRKTLSRVREVGSVLYLNKQNASHEVLSELKQIRGLQVKN